MTQAPSSHPHWLVVEGARTALFVPGDRPERFAKAVDSGADLPILDLEDAVSADAKAGARESVRSWLQEGGRASVRINVADSADQPEDVTALADVPGLVAILVPKAEDPDVLGEIHDRLQVPLIALIETVVGVDRLREITQVPGVARLGFGHLDYSVDLGSESSREAMLSARSSVIFASRLAGLAAPIDGVTAQFRDDDLLADDAAYARDLGFTGKFLIHPRQVAITRDTFSPAPEEVTWAQRVIEAARTAGAVQVDGEMVDAPVVARAERILQRSSSEPVVR